MSVSDPGKKFCSTAQEGGRGKERVHSSAQELGRGSVPLHCPGIGVRRGVYTWVTILLYEQAQGKGNGSHRSYLLALPSMEAPL